MGKSASSGVLIDPSTYYLRIYYRGPCMQQYTLLSPCTWTDTVTVEDVKAAVEDLLNSSPRGDSNDDIFLVDARDRLCRTHAPSYVVHAVMEWLRQSCRGGLVWYRPPCRASFGPATVQVRHIVERDRF